jgi:hypothetical protein
VKLWVDDKPLEAAAEIATDLPRGVHDLTFAIDPSVRSESGLRAEIADIPGSTAHAQAIGGR